MMLGYARKPLHDKLVHFGTFTCFWRFWFLLCMKVFDFTARFFAKFCSIWNIVQPCFATMWLTLTLSWIRMDLPTVSSAALRESSLDADPKAPRPFRSTSRSAEVPGYQHQHTCSRCRWMSINHWWFKATREVRSEHAAYHGVYFMQNQRTKIMFGYRKVHCKILRSVLYIFLVLTFAYIIFKKTTYSKMLQPMATSSRTPTSGCMSGLSSYRTVALADLRLAELQKWGQVHVTGTESFDVVGDLCCTGLGRLGNGMPNFWRISANRCGYL